MKGAKSRRQLQERENRNEKLLFLLFFFSTSSLSFISLFTARRRAPPSRPWTPG